MERAKRIFGEFLERVKRVFGEGKESFWRGSSHILERAKSVLVTLLGLFNLCIMFIISY